MTIAVGQQQLRFSDVKAYWWYRRGDFSIDYSIPETLDSTVSQDLWRERSSIQYYVEMLVPQINFGKVKPSQQVLLKLLSYPAQEFGSVKGTIEFIKNIPSDSGYLANVFLPNGLVTNYKKSLLFTEGLQAQADIITEKRRLSDRFISGLKNILQ